MNQKHRGVRIKDTEGDESKSSVAGKLTALAVDLGIKRTIRTTVTLVQTFLLVGVLLDFHQLLVESRQVGLAVERSISHFEAGD